MYQYEDSSNGQKQHGEENLRTATNSEGDLIFDPSSWHYLLNEANEQGLGIYDYFQKSLTDAEIAEEIKNLLNDEQYAALAEQSSI